MERKIILITGATNGIGKATAIELARHGHHIILHGRNMQKIEACKKDIIAKTGNKYIDYAVADMLDLDSVCRMSEKLAEKYGHLDILLNNAGAQYGKNRETTGEGIEKTMMVNVIAPTLLSLKLLPLLSKSTDGRIITTASAAYRMGGTFYPDDIELEKHYSFTGIYGLSKLYIIWMMRWLENYIERNGIPVTVNITHPGATMTGLGMGSDRPLIWKIIIPLYAIFLANSMKKAIKGNMECVNAKVLESDLSHYYGPGGKERIIDTKYFPERNMPVVWKHFNSIIGKYFQKMD